MKLKRLRIEQVKQFRQSIDITGLTDGINLFVGPNECGKSTLVRAIRAAFFERYRSSSVDDLRPWGDSSAAPEVELEFEWQGSTWKLHKRFLKKHRCDLHIDHQQISDEAAEEKLAELLSYQLPKKGASKAEHWGVPGLLWVEQGSVQEIRGCVDHAGDHLKSALSRSLGEVISTGGDELITQVENARAVLLTRGGQPTGAYKKAIYDCESQQAKLDELNEKVLQYREKVDRLGQLLQKRQEIDAARTQEEYRLKIEAAQESLADAHALQTEQKRDRESLSDCEAKQSLCRDQLQEFDKRVQELAQRAQDEQNAGTLLAERQARTAGLEQRLDDTSQDYQRAKDSLALARQQARRETLQHQYDRVANELKRLTDAYEKARNMQAELQQQRKQLQAQAIDEKVIGRLKLLQSQLAEVVIRRQMLATRLEYQLAPGKTISIGAEPVTGKGECLLLESSVLSIPGVGTLRLQPGGNDVAELAREQGRIESDRDALLQSIYLKSLDEAEGRAKENQLLAGQIERSRGLLEAFAPEGLDALEAKKQLAQQELQKCTADLAQLPPLNTTAADEKIAEGSLAKAEVTLKAVEQASNDHKRDLVLAESALQSAKSERERLSAEVQTPDHKARVKQTQDRLTDLKVEQARLRESINQRQQKIDEANPSALQQDIDRLSRSAKAMEQEATQREIEITTLQAQLETLGAQGLEETRSEVQREAERLQCSRDEMVRRAEALKLLLELLKEKRQALTRQLQAPLQKHLNHYIKLLFPQARLAVDEHLRPTILARTHSVGEEQGDVESLSYGAREQMGLVSRLAYADLLKEAGRPTLIILDDALVHCDLDRLERMKRVLFDAAQRHQILLFSCHPEKWRDLGVAHRDMQALKVSA